MLAVGVVAVLERHSSVQQLLVISCRRLSEAHFNILNTVFDSDIALITNIVAAADNSSSYQLMGLFLLFCPFGTGYVIQRVYGKGKVAALIRRGGLSLY